MELNSLKERAEGAESRVRNLENELRTLREEQEHGMSHTSDLMALQVWVSPGQGSPLGFYSKALVRDLQ